MGLFGKSAAVTFQGDSTKDLVWVYDPASEKHKKAFIFAEPPNDVVHLKNGAVAGVYSGQKIEYTAKKQNGDLNKYYFVNVKMPCQTPWGTPRKLDYKDASTGKVVSIGANGLVSFHIKDGKTFIEKVLGNRYRYGKENLIGEMLPKIIDEFSAHLMIVLDTEKISYAQMDLKLKEIGQALVLFLNAELEKYGIHVEEFIIKEFLKPDELREKANERAEKAGAFDETILDADRKILLLKKQEEYERQQMQMNRSRAEHNIELNRMGARLAADVEKMDYDVKGASYKEMRNLDREDLRAVSEAAATVLNAEKMPEVTVINKTADNKPVCPYCGGKLNEEHDFCPSCGKKVRFFDKNKR
jgi:membrane protease subunit (stomatin/prohibitin family)